MAIFLIFAALSNSAIKKTFHLHFKLVKYLGMIVDNKLTWSQHVDYISSKITHNIGILKSLRHFIPKESLLLLYHTLTEPYFRYCSIVWGQCST